MTPEEFKKRYDQIQQLQKSMKEAEECRRLTDSISEEVFGHKFGEGIRGKLDHAFNPPGRPTKYPHLRVIDGGKK